MGSEAVRDAFLAHVVGRLVLFLVSALAVGSAALRASAAGPVARGASSGEEAMQPFRIDDDLARRARRIASPELSPLRRLRALSRALTSDQELGLEESLDRTSTAMEAHRNGKANCVGFAFLFLAMAREAGVPVFFVLAEDFGKEGVRGTLRIREEHLAVGYGPPHGLRVFDFAGESGPDELRVRPVTDLTAIALYHSNRGVELMLDGRYEASVRWLERAVELDPALAAARINLGVARRRVGDFEGAVAEYQEALEIDPGAAAAYQSLASLMRLAGREGEAAELLADAERLAEGDAFIYLSLARQHLLTGDVQEARAYYRKALELSGRR